MDDQRHGIWHSYSEDGVHQVSRSYEHGRKQGLTVSFGQTSPRIELWSSIGLLDLETKEPVARTQAVETL